ncbi:MAG TPA: hypothetical protein VNI79_07455 [Sphingomicrobium sp.]|nr:hypothetical protein [Sphingomicrobium sp.]
MFMRLRLARLFTIQTRTEALLVTYAIAVGAIERGVSYMHNYPGNMGVVLALACLGVPLIAGAKLIDAVKPVKVPAVVPLAFQPRRSERRSFGKRTMNARPGRAVRIYSRRSD